MVLSRVTRIVAIISSKSHVLVSVRGSPEKNTKVHVILKPSTCLEHYISPRKFQWDPLIELNWVDKIILLNTPGSHNGDSWQNKNNTTK